MSRSAAGAFEVEAQALIARVREPDPAGRDRAWERLDALTKPPRSLGALEELAARVACVQGTVRPSAGPSAIVLFAGDHGVVAEGVSAWPQEVTVQMVANLAAGGAAVNQLAASAGARLLVVDVGVAGDTSAYPGVMQATVRPGTRNLAVEPAMTREEAAEAFMVGARVAGRLAREGCRFIGTGEMGIGNTTPASALVAAFTGADAAAVTGRGTGIGDAALAAKTGLIARAIAMHSPLPDDPLGTLAALGGLEIAALAGVFVGGAAEAVCVVCDGLISTSAAVAASRLCPACVPYVIASHRSEEPGHALALEALGLEPYLQLRMRLGEGTGAALGLGVIAGACAMMAGMATFAEAGVSGRDDG